jgi:hypothetical protein
MRQDDADEASVLHLRQQIVDEWPESDTKDTVLEALDALVRTHREGQEKGGSFEVEPKTSP